MKRLRRTKVLTFRFACGWNFTNSLLGRPLGLKSFSCRDSSVLTHRNRESDTYRYWQFLLSKSAEDRRAGGFDHVEDRFKTLRTAVIRIRNFAGPVRAKKLAHQQHMRAIRPGDPF